MGLASLPVEVLSIIVRMARYQDEAYAERSRVDPLISSTFADSGQYGRSLQSLGACSRVLGDLTRQHIFETISFRWVNKDTQFFYDTIVPKYKDLIHHIKLDGDYDESVSLSVLDELALLIIASGTFRHLSRLSFVYRRALIDLHFLLTVTMKLRPPLSHCTWDVDQLRASMNGRLRRITSLSVQLARHHESYDILFKVFPCVRHLHREVTMPNGPSLPHMAAANSKDGEMLTLANLEVLDVDLLADLIREQRRDPRPVRTTPSVLHQIPTAWSYFAWKSPPRDLRLRSAGIGFNEWSFVRSLHYSLQTLTLRNLFDVDVTELPSASFPLLRSIHLTGMPSICLLLTLFSESPLEHVDLELQRIDEATLTSLTSSDPKENLLSRFSSTLKTLRLVTLGFDQPAKLVTAVAAYCHQAGVIHRSTPPRIHDALSSLKFLSDGRSLADDELHTTAEASRDLLRYAQARIAVAEAAQDGQLMSQISRVLQPLASMQQIEKD